MFISAGQPGHSPWQLPSPVLRFHITRTQEVIEVPEEDVEEAVKPWEQEPQDLQSLMDTYIVENKFAAAIPGAMLYLTKAETRAGERVDVTADQKNKLFMVTNLQVNIPPVDIVVSHVIPS